MTFKLFKSDGTVETTETTWLGYSSLNLEEGDYVKSIWPNKVTSWGCITKRGIELYEDRLDNPPEHILMLDLLT